MKKKKILIILDDLFTGGALTLNRHLFSTLAGQSDYEFYLLCGIFPNQQYLLKGFSFCRKIYTYPMVESRNQLGNFVFIAFNTRKLIKKILLKEKFDYVIFNFPFSAVGAILSGKINRGNTFSLFHGAIFLEKKSLLCKARLNFLQNLRFSLITLVYKLTQKTMLSYGKVICFSQYSKRLLKRAFNIKKKIHVLSVPCFKTEFSERNKKRFKEELGFSKDIFIFLIASRIEPRKGIHLAIEAMRYLFEEKQKIKVLIIGPIWNNAVSYFMDLYQHAKFYDENTVFFKNEVSFEVLQKYYYSADATIMPSVDLETFGMTTLESLSFGVPVIGIPVGATKEILSRINEKLLAEKANAKSLAKVIKWYLHLSNKQRKRISMSCTAFVRQFYDPQKTLNQLKRIIG